MDPRVWYIKEIEPLQMCVVSRVFKGKFLCLCFDPCTKLIVCDEPTAALDAKADRGIMQILKDISTLKAFDVVIQKIQFL